MHGLRIIFPILLLCGAASAQETVPVDMASGWFRRDWAKCQGRSQFTLKDGAATISSNHSAALFWQIPTRSGSPLPVDRSQKWIQECDRPPPDFGKTVLKQDREGGHLLDASEYRYISWRWRTDGTIDDRATVDEKGKIQKEGDDFAAKLGISILKKNSDSLREIAYVWTRSIPEETVIYQEKKILFWRYRYHRIVAESGEENVNTWVSEVRDLYADYRRVYPDEEPGRIVRIYLMSDSDNTSDRITGAFAGIQFHKQKPDSFAGQ